MLAAVAVAAGLLIGSSGAAASRRAAVSTYGGYPTWLPRKKAPAVNTILNASPSHPQLDAIEGNTMEVALPAGAEAEITAVGPSFPTWVAAAAQAGTLSEGSAVPAAFTVTVIARRGTVPLRASAFSILTAAGQLLHPAISGPGGKPAPAALRAGQHLSLTVNAKLTEGDGSLRWAPTGARVVSGWLYQLELD
ncbi:MAG TPA: hypothetical protein VK778_14935 [Solirubrobacteraceae bacterium]|nr:hypothetical protein [Solirubrobacteraceae bacterium]